MSATTTPLHKQLHTEAQFESAMKALTATKGNRAEAVNAFIADSN